MIATLRQAQQFFRGFDRAPDGFQISAGYQPVEIRDIQVFIQVDGIIDPGLFRGAQQEIRLFQLFHLVFREIHVELDELKPEAAA